LVSESDNYSENANGMDESRSRLGIIRPERRKSREGLSRSREKDRGKGEIEQEMKLNEQLKEQYEA
jgi:hypothetical protein